jgi:CheY-like chemotaxis protein
MRLSGSETVLAVDDDPSMLGILEEVLKPLGYKVLSAGSGEEADLLLTDVMLPGIKGQELAKKMLHSCPDVNVLFMSGYLCPSMAHSDSEQGFEAFIQKPFAPNTLLRKIRKLLD